MHHTYAYYDPYDSGPVFGSEIFYIILVLALIILAIIWVLGGFSGPDFPKSGLEGDIKQIFNTEVAAAGAAGEVGSITYLQNAQGNVLAKLRKVGAIP